MDMIGYIYLKEYIEYGNISVINKIGESYDNIEAHALLF